MRITAVQTKTEQVVGYLEDAIFSGRLRPGERMPSTRVLADQFKVSKQVVQSALKELKNNGKIDTYAGKGAFVAENRQASDKLKTAVLVLDGTTDSHTRLPQALLPLFHQRGYVTNLFDFKLDDSLGAREGFSRLLTGKPEILVLDAFNFPFELLAAAHKDTRIVFINRFEGKRIYDNASYILEDYEAGGYLMAKEVMRKGARRLAAFTFTRKRGWTSDLFAKGCERACKEFGAEDFTLYNGFGISDEEFLELAKKKKGLRPEALLIYPVFIAAKFCKLLRKTHLRIPDDLMIVGYGDTPWAEAYELTTLRSPIDEMTTKVAEVIDQRIRVDVKLSPKLVYRNSCQQYNKQLTK